jgi:hypothetical protein
MRLRPIVCLVCAGAVCCAPSLGHGADAGDPVALRVESEVFAGQAKEPVARSLTLFDGGTTWDFLDPSAPHPARKVADAAGCEQIILHDPVRERVIVLDPRRKLKTQIDVLRLERLSASLCKWSRSSDDKLIRWAGSADIGGGISEGNGSLELVGPRVKYTIHYTAAPTPEMAKAYRTFADTAILLKALLQPGGMPPFPRLAINRRIESAGGIPSDVTLAVDPLLPIPGTSAGTLRSVHKVLPQLTDADQTRIDDAAALMAVADEVDLAAFVGDEKPEQIPGS